MGCLYCRKNISPLRKLKDPHFCSDEHREKFASKSARALREAEDLYGFSSTVIVPKPEDKSERRGGFGATIFVGGAIAVLLLAFSQMSSNSPAAPKAISPLPDNPHNNRGGGFAQTIGNLIQTQASGTLREDFHSGVSNWDGLKSLGSDWSVEAGQVRPASLRVWKPSTSLSNY